MSIIFYTRVSTLGQAEQGLSLPAQRKLLHRYAESGSYEVDGSFEDVASGRSFHGRPGLMKAVALACYSSRVDQLVVHRIDRIARNSLDYLTLKAKLRQHSVHIVSLVEHFDVGPIGELAEMFMAAIYEFQSAYTATEVERGLRERLERGKWNGRLPIGYVKDRVHDMAVPDPARAHFITEAFERYATGTLTSTELADDLWRRGFVSVHGKRIHANKLCEILHNPFYAGIMRVAGQHYPGAHHPIISMEVFDQVQELFRQKNSGGRPQRKLCFILARKVRCPQCARLLTGEETVKKNSGKAYRYYRCGNEKCRFRTRADELEQQVIAKLLADGIPENVVAIVRKREREAKRKRTKEQADLVRRLRAQRRSLEDQLKEMALSYARGTLRTDDYDRDRLATQRAIRVTEWFLHAPNRAAPRTSKIEPHELTLEDATRLEEDLVSGDVKRVRRAVDAIVQNVAITRSGTSSLATQPAYRCGPLPSEGRTTSTMPTRQV